MSSQNGRPERRFMDAADIKWANGKPDYTIVDNLYARERSHQHAPDSLEINVENLVKTFEMEFVHKIDPKQWQTLDQSTEDFFIQSNGGKKFSLSDLMVHGNYNVFLMESPLYDTGAVSNKRSFELFKTTFPGGFAWELLKVFTGPPEVVFSWRHWAKQEGAFAAAKPTGKTVEMFGMAIAKVSTDLKVQSLQVYYDPTGLIGKLCQFNIEDWAKCPYANKEGI